MPPTPDLSSDSRRRFLGGLATAGALIPAGGALAAGGVELGLPGGPSDRPITRAFPQKGPMILQRTRPPLLETPMEVFDRGVFTPNDQFFVRWHWAVIPTKIDVDAYKLGVGGAVRNSLNLSLDDLLRMPRVELAAVNQCSGNSRGLFQPRIAGGQWAHGAMGNAHWVGVSLKHILDKAGVNPGAVCVRFSGKDKPVVDTAPAFAKSLSVDHAREGEVMVAFQMNGQQLPLLNGFPLRLVVPGWYSTYWVKVLDYIEVLDHADDGYWMAKAYKIPATPRANVAPDATGFPTTPINRMVPRSWITSAANGAHVPLRPALPVGGVAMGGDRGLARVDVSADGGRSWSPARLGPDMGRYSFRRFDADLPLRGRGPLSLITRCTNTEGAVQAMTPNWNPGGFMRDCVETTTVVVA